MRFLAAASMLLACAFLGACDSAPRVNTDFNPGYDFSAARKFAIVGPSMAPGAATVPGDLVNTRIETALQNSLRARGYELVAPAGADLLVSWFLTTRDKTQVTTYNDSIGYRRCWSMACRGMVTSVDVKNYREGTLFIDFIDPRTRQLQWRAATSKRLDPSRSSAERTALINESVNALIGAFPPAKP